MDEIKVIAETISVKKNQDDIMINVFAFEKTFEVDGDVYKFYLSVFPRQSGVNFILTLYKWTEQGFQQMVFVDANKHHMTVDTQFDTLNQLSQMGDKLDKSSLVKISNEILEQDMIPVITSWSYT